VRRKIEERDQPAIGLSYLLERQKIAPAPADTTYALVGSYVYTWRRTDVLLTPRAGWNAAVELDAAPPAMSSRGFGRVVAKWEYFQPLARNVDASLRTEAGAVLASSSDSIPQAMLFRTGGDTTVRGYAFESLGVQKDGAVVGGRYYALASTESVYWVRENLGIAAFFDAGNAWDDMSMARLALGYGLGGRVRTPAGPLRLDVAYGQDVHQFRLHFSFGLTF
jgi:translocation and assembly module TamA